MDYFFFFFFFFKKKKGLKILHLYISDIAKNFIPRIIIDHLGA
jgi:hypothetical protein